MKYLIGSDIHGSAKSCEKLMSYFEELKCDRLILLGDSLYFGPRNTIPEGYDVKEVARILNSYADKIIAVRGNCDAEVDQAMFTFPMLAEYVILSELDVTYFITHGDHYNPMHLPALLGIDVLLTGHTHIPACEDIGDFTYCNPGSVTIPKGGSEKSFMTLEGRILKWHKLEDGSVYMQKGF